MKKLIRLLPLVSLIIVIFVAAAVAASNGNIFGSINGNSSISISQVLYAESIAWVDSGLLPPELPSGIHLSSVSRPARDFAAVKDDGTAFSASAEISSGDQVALMLTLKNRGQRAIAGQLTLTAGTGLSFEVYSPSDSFLRDVIRLGPSTWQFVVNPDFADQHLDYLYIVIAASDDYVGNTGISGVLIQCLNINPGLGTIDFSISDNNSGTAVMTVGSVQPGDNGAAKVTLQNNGSSDCSVSVIFSNVINIGGTLGEFGDNAGQLGSVAEMAAFIDKDHDGTWGLGDVGLKSDGNHYNYPTSLVYDIFNNYGSHSWMNAAIVPHAQTYDFIVLWRVPTSAGNEIQGDSLKFDMAFAIEQLH
jgi:hypothetical protein